MTEYTIPDFFFDSLSKQPSINLINYKNNNQLSRSRILFSQNVLSFLVTGSKEIHSTQKPVKFGNDHFVIIVSGRCLMTEITSSGIYQSILMTFDDQLLDDFRHKYLDKTLALIDKPEMIVFPYDDYTLNIRDSLMLLTPGLNTPHSLKQVKLEEILIYLMEKYPKQTQALLASTSSELEMNFKKVVENNILSNLKVEELAFLCNMSVSTFKRYFQKYYGTSPNKWILHQKMEMAGILLQKQKRPNEIYDLLGYETYSNFAKAFKQFYSISPKQYQSMNL